MASEHQPRIAYFTPEFRVSKNNIFQSQVLEQATSLTEAGFKCMLVGSELNEESVEDAKALAAVRRLDAVDLWPVYPEKASAREFFRLAGKVADRAEKAIAAWRPDAIYVRAVTSFKAAGILAHKVGARVIFDARGLAAEESAYTRGRRTLANRYLRWLEHNCWRKADRLVCVSKQFQNWISTAIGRDDIEVVPCCVNPAKFRFNPDARAEVRRRLGWAPDAPTAVYSGGLSVWQRVDDVLQLMTAMKRIEPRLKCLLLTGSPDEMTRLAEKAGLRPEDFDCRCVRYCEISDWLSAADAGVILRDDVPVNNVASPVKISEYLACGLGVIASTGIGDMSDLLEQRRVGVLLGPDDDRDTAARKAADLAIEASSSPEIRRQAQALVGQRLAWRCYHDVYRRLIVGTSGEPSGLS